MSQQRMAGSDQFKAGMNQAAKGPGNRSYKTDGQHLKGAGAWDRQVSRETAQKDNAALTGSTGASNLADYINVSKSATQANGDFSIDNANKYVDNSRDQSKINKSDNEGFSSARREENVNYANKQMDNNMARNEGFAMGTTNNFINNAKDHREDNTAKATAFADRTVDKYIQKNKDTQAINVGEFDKQVRSAPIVDKAYSTVQGNNTFGDMYSYSKKELPAWKTGTPMQGTQTPDFQNMYNQTKDDLDKYKV
tara:strand:+ start:646 stop:1401 length:756 start_codon:yes stop_codon:yes gene_type:complete